MDGVRGIASLAVCLWHNFLAFFPGAVNSNIAMKAPIIEKYIYRSPLDILFAGDFAVYIFFMLSGFVISIKFFGSFDIEVLKKAFFKRYIRLMPPALVTVLAAYLLLINGLMFNRQAAALASSWWLELNWRDVVPTLQNALQYGLYDLWFVGYSASSSFNSNLGTLLIETLGSFMIFIIIYIYTITKLSLSSRYSIHAGIIVLSLIIRPNDPHYTIFFSGMATADLYRNSPHIFTKMRYFGIPILLFGLFLASFNIGNLTLPYAPYHWVGSFFNLFGLHPLIYPWALGAVLVVLGVILTPQTHKFLESRPCQILGEYSFALYLTHTVFLGSVTCFLFTKFHRVDFLSYGETVFLSFFVGLPLLIGATHLVKKVDDLAVRLSRKI
jgi:peptidoglycan/LPS O-acetylase OafA/YrhL